MEEIKRVLADCVARAIEGTNKKIDSDKSHKPFHRALLLIEIVKMSASVYTTVIPVCIGCPVQQKALPTRIVV